MPAIIVFTTCPDDATAQRIADDVVDSGLAACVNCLGGIVSTYRWQGLRRSECEVLLVFKTTRERFDALRTRIAALHPYEVPEVIALDVVAGSAAYLDWIAASVGVDRART